MRILSCFLLALVQYAHCISPIITRSALRGLPRRFAHFPTGPKKSVPVVVTSLSGVETTYEVDISMSIGDVKARVCDKLNYNIILSPSQIEITFGPQGRPGAPGLYESTKLSAVVSDWRYIGVTRWSMKLFSRLPVDMHRNPFIFSEIEELQPHQIVQLGSQQIRAETTSAPTAVPRTALTDEELDHMYHTELLRWKEQEWDRREKAVRDLLEEGTEARKNKKKSKKNKFKK